MFIDKAIRGKLVQNNKVYDNLEIRRCVNNIKKTIYSIDTNKKETVFALALPRTIHLIYAIFALLESRVPFLPLDMEQPKERIEYMLNHAQINNVLTLPEFEYDFGHRKSHYLSVGLSQEFNFREIDSSTNEIAYILYTSGSTGEPKGVEITRKGFANFLESIPKTINFEQGKKIACFTNVTFDIFFLESILSIYKGLTVILANEEEQNNPKKMIDLLTKYQVEMLQITPSRLRMLRMVDSDLKCLEKVETIMVGGEAFPYELLLDLQAKTNARIYNMYGPTETTIWSSVSDLTDKKKINIGNPIKGTSIYILTEELIAAKKGEIGEICIGGIGLARGYLNDEIKTNEGFCMLPFEPYERIYRTGDLGKYDEDGDLICLGRKDQQVKLNGHRIELEEIDISLTKKDGIEQAVTCFDPDSEILISFYISEKEIATGVLLKHMENLLPKYMIPSKFYLVDDFCYTTSGKIDRIELLKCKANKQQNTDSGRGFVNKEGNMVIQKITKIIEQTLKDDNLLINYNHSLYELGINSMNYIKIIIDIEEVFDVEFEAEKLVITAFNTINMLAEYVEKMISKNNSY